MAEIKELVEEANKYTDFLYAIAEEVSEKGGNLRLVLSDEHGGTIAYIILDGADDKLFRATSLVQ